MGYIESQEIVDAIRSYLAHHDQISFPCPGYEWDEGHSFCKVKVFNYILTLFVDAGELDYVDSAETDDGREGDFDYWTAGSKISQQEPLEMLSDEELERLTEIIKNSSTTK